jgi:SAM-dependent methyltransferase
MANIDAEVVAHFGDEWQRFDQAALGTRERTEMFDAYFHVFPWAQLPPGAVGIDAGCGSGRWAALVAPRVGLLHCVDASAGALAVARRNVRANATNAIFTQASIDALPMADDSLDFGYSLGVLHHMPDPAAGLRALVAKLKPGAPCLVYLYYAFDNRPAWFRALWRASDLLRRGISRLPPSVGHAVADAVAVAVYWPLARLARLGERIGLDVTTVPLAAYRRRSLYTMRTDALDRFATGLEHRFTRAEVAAMMGAAGLGQIRVSETAPYWVACGVKASASRHQVTFTKVPSTT